VRGASADSGAIASDSHAYHGALRGLITALPAAAATLTVVVVGVTMFRTFFGDANIYLPFAQNAAHGDFFSFNPHSFSSGATSPLWTILLALPFVIGTGVIGAKVFALLMTVAATIATIAAAYRVTGSLAAAGMASFYLVGALVVWGVVMFDSPQVVILVSLTIIVGEAVAMRWQQGASLSIRLKVLVGVTWGLLLFARPDAAVLVAVQAAGLWLSARDRSARSRLLTLVSIAVLAAIPSLVYYSYSELTLGTFSVASRARAYTLLEAASHLGPLAYSRPMLGYFVLILFALAMAALGVRQMWVEPRQRWLAIYISGAIVGYALALTFAAPVTAFMSRYFVPTAPLIVVAIARCITALADEWSIGETRVSGAVAAVLLPIATFTAGSNLLVLGEAAVVVALVLVGIWLYAGLPRYRHYFRYALLLLGVVSAGALLRRYVSIRSLTHIPTVELGLIAVVVVAGLVVLGAKIAPRPQFQLPLARLCASLALVLVSFLLISQLSGAIQDARFQSGLGYSFDQIEEKDAVDIINQTAKPGEAVLGYEVQDRLLLRSDVRLLSLDGLTDGIATPYLQTGRMEAFIRAYHPQYWIANDAVEYRPSLKGSFLYPVYEKFKTDPLATQVESDGVTFRILQRRTTPWPLGSTGWWRFIVTIQVA
jgi:hypothetical protein